MKFKKLKLNGFKSFVEPIDLEIQDGLTGIVGPNGCGKSNVVEAIKWVMGESSAKQMRGDDMDDVIFGGSSNRPARDASEVSIVLDNTEVKSLTQFNEYDELEVNRRIERGKGSSWTINSNSVRAKDVNLLFADNSSGARSSGIVSQGQVANLINAKPDARRTLLEEAANITGLHQRRHEAELRLNAAETNLERLGDIVITMEEQKKSLSKQARQASRYKSIGDRLRKAESILLLKKYLEKEESLKSFDELFNDTSSNYNELTKKLHSAEENRIKSNSNLPALRKKETESFAKLQNLKINLSSIDNELIQISDNQNKAKTSLNNISENIKRENSLSKEAKQVLNKLDEESKTLSLELNSQETNYKKDTENLNSIRDELEKIENQQAEINSVINTNKYKFESLSNEKITLSKNAEELSKESTEYNIETNDQKINQLKEEISFNEKNIISCQKNIDKNKISISKASADQNKYKEIFEISLNYFRDIEAEYNALTKLLNINKTEKNSKLSEKIKVKDGFENSVSHVLGESLEGSLVEGDKPYWVKLQKKNNLSPPEKTEPLGNFIKKSSFAKLSLSSVGIAKTEEDAKEMQSQLLPGQAITTSKGGLWRWDGFIIPVGSNSSVSEFLRQNNRLRTLKKEINSYSEKLNSDEDNYKSYSKKYEDLKILTDEESSKLFDLKQNKASLEFKLNETVLEHKNNIEKRELKTFEIKKIEKRIFEIDSEIKKFSKDKNLEQKLNSISKVSNKLREELSDKISNQAKLEQNKVFKISRIKDIKQEIIGWEKRIKDSNNQFVELKAKENEIKNYLNELSNKPSKLEKEKNNLLSEIDLQEVECKKISDELIVSERKFNEIDSECKNIEIELRTANEKRIKAESEKNIIESELDLINQQILSKFNCAPYDLKENKDIKVEDTKLTHEELENRQNRLIRERDEMGPVNLRAEIEMKELEQQISNILLESEDLQNAIDKLRLSIKTLNREGKERILVSFEKVQVQFQKIFKQLFSGGEAKLEFTDPSDPLNSGLEIMAKPPGKKLQTLSLLSGGEKALTAISLLFAVFLTNPSPLCVLDEVDAPLDDTNVARFCDLLDEIKDATNTRFMIITHHRLTMARMDRLYGVTMSENGVSQLVSVNLEKAIKLKETA